MNENRIYVVDDEENIQIALREALEAEGFSVNCYGNPRIAFGALKKDQPELVITDLVMPEIDGLKLIEKIKSTNPEINVVVITAHATLDSAIQAIRLGASDYLVKPFKIAELLDSVRKALSQKRIPSTEKAAEASLKSRYDYKNLIGVTAAIGEIRKLVDKVAKTDSSILIIGESGTGKEMVARTIHFHSKRSAGPFVSINCAALPETLLESELFGYEKGAFTGAVASKLGLFELAEKGTFLLDEVGEMPVSLQVKLLRVLQERILRRLGGVRDIKTDFRLIAATSKNLPEQIKIGLFREELFYRLNVIPIFMPPLRERKEDIQLFAEYFLRFYSKRHEINRVITFTREAQEIFRNYNWPGNIRELENVIERLVTMTESDSVDGSTVEHAIKSGHFSNCGGSPITNTVNLNGAVDQFEKELIEGALRKEKGNQNRAAKRLGMSRQSLYYKLKKYDIVMTGGGDDAKRQSDE